MARPPTRDDIARRLAETPPLEDLLTADDLEKQRVAAAARALTPAAVLLLVVDHPREPTVLFTQRTAHLADHAGQISFPGGRSEPQDQGPPATALREAEEEVGLPRRQVEVIGELPAYTTITRYVVTPVVALVRGPLELSQLALDRHEVAAAYEVPLSFLMNPAHHRRHVFTWEGGQRQFLSMPWRREGTAEADEVFIWGATAAMLRNLYRYLGD